MSTGGISDAQKIEILYKLWCRNISAFCATNPAAKCKCEYKDYSGFADIFTENTSYRSI